jgi:hypothetical protein
MASDVSCCSHALTRALQVQSGFGQKAATIAETATSFPRDSNLIAVSYPQLSLLSLADRQIIVSKLFALRLSTQLEAILGPIFRER